MKKFFISFTSVFMLMFVLSISVYADLSDPECFVAVFLLPKKKIAISVSEKLDPKRAYYCHFELKKDKDLKKFLEWYADKLPSKEIVKKVNVTFIQEVIEKGKPKRKVKKIKKKDEKIKFIEMAKKSGIMDEDFFYLLAKGGRVVEIQGVADFLKIYYTEKYGKEINIPFRNQITVLAFQDILGVKNRGSEILGAKAGLGSPFFLSVEDFLSGIELAHRAYRSLTRESKMLKLLDSLPSDRDRCLTVMVEGLDPADFKSRKVMEKIWFSCKSAYEKSEKASDKLPLFHAMISVTINGLVNKKANVVKKDDYRFLIKELENLKDKARTRYERVYLERTGKFLSRKIASI